ncbi:MAG TPA: hypothetical protein VMV31_14245 [Terriglobales bacterium]|nr:hypothetical protein [Terriglobales bacterium]
MAEKAKAEEAPWLRFLRRLDSDPKAGRIVRAWLDAGCDLRLIFVYAAGPANPTAARVLAANLEAKRERGAKYKKAATTVLKGLNGAAAVFGGAPELPGAKAAREAEVAAWSERLRRTPAAFGAKRWGKSDHVDAYPLCVLRRYASSHVGAEVTPSDVVAVAEAAVLAWRPGANFSREAAERALRRFEHNNPNIPALLDLGLR